MDFVALGFVGLSAGADAVWYPMAVGELLQSDEVTPGGGHGEDASES